MKQLLLLNIILAALLTPVQAATVTAYATEVKATDGDFSATAGGTALSDVEIQSIIADGYTPLFGLSATDYSIIDLGFGDNTAVTGSGVDLVIYSLWYGYEYSFGLEAFDQAFDSNGTPTPISSNLYTVDSTSILPGGCIDDGCTAQIAATSINLFDLNNVAALENGIELGYISLFIGGDTLNGAVGGLDAYSNFSLAGAVHTDAAVVPLPLSAVLFSSGLALLGWVGRRKTA